MKIKPNWKCVFISLIVFQASVKADWFDRLPVIVDKSSSLEYAQEVGATLVLGKGGTDPGWGVNFSLRDTSFKERSSEFLEKGIRSLGFQEGFGQAFCPITELDSENNIVNDFWTWEQRGNGRVVWQGAHVFFDNLWWGRPYTRTKAEYRRSPMKFPNGTEAKGYVPNSKGKTIENPFFSNIFRAGGGRSVDGVLAYAFEFNEKVSAKPNGGLHPVPTPPDFKATKYSGLITMKKDASCPHWADYAYASTTQSLMTSSGVSAFWVDNFGPWDSMNIHPIEYAFGNWSYQKFKHWLTKRTTPAQRSNMGITDYTNFNIRDYLKNKAVGYGYDVASPNYRDQAWKGARWKDDQVWQAYKIYLRENGTSGLQNYYDSVKNAGKDLGRDSYLLANDSVGFNLGWNRTIADMSSIEFDPGWGLATGPLGNFGLYPRARYAPIYKVAREHAKSPYVNVWFYTHKSYSAELENADLQSSIFYEMLANHTTPKTSGVVHAEPSESKNDPRYLGSPGVNKAFFKFVSEKAVPAYGKRRAVYDVGVLQSSSSLLLELCPSHFVDHNNQPHQFSLWGWSTALSKLHYQYRIVPEWKWSAEELNSLKVAILPNAQALSGGQIDALYNWVSEGGYLIVVGNSGSRMGEDGFFKHVGMGRMKTLTGCDNHELATNSSKNKVGSGTVRYINNDDALSYYKAGDLERPDFLTKLGVELADAFGGVENDIISSLINAPAEIGLNVYEDVENKKLFIDANNMKLDADFKIVHTPNFTVRINQPSWAKNKTLKKITSISPDGEITSGSGTLLKDGRLQILMNGLKFYRSVIVEFNP